MVSLVQMHFSRVLELTVLANWSNGLGRSRVGFFTLLLLRPEPKEFRAVAGKFSRALKERPAIPRHSAGQ
jgi:hypothetical protein